MRHTKSPRQAADRLRAAFPTATANPKKRKPHKELALLVFSLRVQHVPREEVQQAMRWYGRIPMDGLSGWQEEALEWGRVER